MNTNEFDFKVIKVSGFLMLILLILLCGGSAFAIPHLTGNTGLLVTVSVILLIILSIVPIGFVINEPNNARVMIFFGKYCGTLRDNGFFWVNPFYLRRKITLRARNLESPPIKVNDRSGNPIMIGMVLVWKVSDTYKAVFEIDTSGLTSNPNATSTARMSALMKSFEKFVNVQCDAALREVAGQYAYDNDAQCEDTTLRSGGQSVNTHLERTLNERLAIAGIAVVEARINNLAYAPEIAAVMLRRQQAAAIISAREKIVEGAVSMVQMALEKLSKEQIVELDDDKKAAMVSNLLVVLCSEDTAKPVVNTGTLHN